MVRHPRNSLGAYVFLVGLDPTVISCALGQYKIYERERNASWCQDDSLPRCTSFAAVTTVAFFEETRRKVLTLPYSDREDTMTRGDEDEKLSYVYLRSNDNSWVPAKQLKVDGDKAKVARAIFKNEQEMLSCAREGKQKYADNELIDLNEYPNKVLPMQNVDVNGNLEDYKDMVELPFMHEVSSDCSSMALTSF